MPRTCTICRHPERAAIESALIAGTPFRGIAAQFQVSDSALLRHKAKDLPVSLLKAAEIAEVVDADNLLAQVRDLQTRTLAILSKAEEAEDLRTALGGVRECRGNLELLARMVGQVKDKEGSTVNVAVGGDWNRIQAVLLTALDQHPAARLAVVEAIRNAGI